MSDLAIFDGVYRPGAGIVVQDASLTGARIAVELETPDGPRTVHVEVTTGGSFGASSLQQEIGLANATKIAKISIFWPASGTTDRYADVAMDKFYAVREGDSKLTPVDVKKIDLARFAPR